MNLFQGIYPEKIYRMLIGVSLKNTDKRVDKMLRAGGIPDADIYYSPIVSWVMLALLLLSSASGIMILAFTSLYGLILIPYFLLAYLFNAHKNNSFALHQDELIVINPNAPFRHLSIIKLADIKHVTFDEHRSRWQELLLWFGGNYLLIETAEGKRRFYCSGLEMDAFNENWTEKTIENLEAGLKAKGIETHFNIH